MKKCIMGLVGLLLSAAMVFAAGNSQGQGGAGSGSANYGARTTGPNYWLVKSAQPVTLHAVNSDEPNVNWGPGEDITNNGWTKGMKEYLNVNVVTDWVSAGSEYDTKMNLSIASRQLPDVFRVNAVQFKQLLDAGMLADITDYIENNASDTIKTIMAYVPEVTATAFRNGRQYGFPVYGYGPIPMPKLLWIRHDWMEASGAKIPGTIAEYENLMKTFQAAHPGSYGMGLNKDLDEMYWLAAAFKAYPGYWITSSNGTIVNGGVQPEMREVLRTFADWYQKGYLRKDFMALDMAAVGQDTVSGKQGINIFPQWWYTYAADTVKNNGNDAYFEAYEMPSATGSPVIHPRDFDNGNYIVINKNCKNIDAAIKCISFIQYIVTDVVAQKLMTQSEIDKYLYTGQGLHVMDMFKLEDPVDEEKQYVQIQYAKRTGDTSGFTSSMTLNKYNYARNWVNNHDTDGIDEWLQMYHERAAYATNTKVYEQNRYILSRMAGPPPDDVAAYGKTLDDVLREGFTKIIIGQEPLSYFDTLVRQWQTAGGNVATAAMNKEYGGK